MARTHYSVPALAALGLLLALPQPGAAATLSGSLDGLSALRGGASARLVTVRAVRPDTGKVAGAERLGRSFGYRLSVPRGPYVVIGSAASLTSERAFQGVSDTVLLRRGRRSVSPDMRRTRRPRRGAAARPGSARAAARNDPIGVDPKTRVIDPDTAPDGVAIDGLIITELLAKPCPDGKPLTVVEIRHRKELREEIKRSRDPDFDPETRLENKLIAPQIVVGGGGSAGANGQLSIQLQATAAGGGESVASATASGPASDLVKLVKQLVDELRMQLCREFPRAFTGSVSATRQTADVREGWSASGVTYELDPLFGGAPIYQLSGGTVQWELMGMTSANCTVSANATLLLGGSSDGYDLAQGPSGQLSLSFDGAMYSVTGSYDKEVRGSNSCEPDARFRPFAPWLDSGEQRPVGPGGELSGSRSDRGVTWQWSLSPVQ